MSLRHLRYFSVINEQKSFLGAAKVLETSQPSLSKQIKDLEGFLGCKLFSREKNVLTLTKAGEIFAKESKKTLFLYEQFLNKAKTLDRKNPIVLKVGVLIGTENQLPKFLLDALTTDNPLLKIEMVSGNDRELVRMLDKGLIEIALTRKNINNAEVKSFAYTEHDLLFIYSKNYKIDFENQDFEGCAGIEFIIPSQYFGLELNEQMTRILEDNFLDSKIVMETENAFVTINYVRMGIGCAILPQYITDIITDDICLKPFNKINPKIKLYLNVKNSLDTEILDKLISDINFNN